MSSSTTLVSLICCSGPYRAAVRPGRARMKLRRLSRSIPSRCDDGSGVCGCEGAGGLARATGYVRPLPRLSHELADGFRSQLQVDTANLVVLRLRPPLASLSSAAGDRGDGRASRVLRSSRRCTARQVLLTSSLRSPTSFYCFPSARSPLPAAVCPHPRSRLLSGWPARTLE